MAVGRAEMERRPRPVGGRPGLDRSERIGLAVAIGGHVVLFGLLSAAWLRPPPPPPAPTPVAVSLVEEVAIKAAAPRPIAPPAASIAAAQGPPDNAAPAPEPVRPRPPRPVVEAARPQPAILPRPEPTPEPKRARSKPPELRPPEPRPRAAVADAVAPPKVRTDHAKPAATRAAAAPDRPAAPVARSAALARVVASVGADAATGTAPGHGPRGSRLGADFEQGLADQPSRSHHVAPPAAAMDGKAMADIASKIIEQVQPCANRQVKPGPGAERIRVTIRLRLNRDGSLAANPQVIAPASGVDDENSRYVGRVADSAIATFKGCSPLRGLPVDLYDVTNGWSDFSLRYKLPG